MLAVRLENGDVSVRRLPVPRRPDGFAAIRLIYGGICNTDLELQRGYYGFRGTPGHEFVGSGGGGPSRVDRRARGGRDQPGLRTLRVLRAWAGPSLPATHGARDREASGCIQRVADAAGGKSAPCSARDFIGTRRLRGAARGGMRDSGPGANPGGRESGGAGRWEARAAGGTGPACRGRGGSSVRPPQGEARNRARCGNRNQACDAEEASARRVRLGSGRLRLGGRSGTGRHDDPAARYGNLEVDGTRLGARRYGSRDCK